MATLPPSPEQQRPPRSRWSKVWHSFDGLAGDTLWSGLHDFAQLVTALLSFYFLLEVLTTEQYGAYLGLYGLLGAFGAVSYAGVGLALLQRLLGEGDEPNEALRSFLSLALLIGVAASAIAIVVGRSTLSLTTVEVVFIVLAELVAVAVVFMTAMLVQAATGFPAASRVKLGVIVLRLSVLLLLVATDNLTIRNLSGGFLILFTVYAAFLVAVHLPRHGYNFSLGWPSTRSMRASIMFSAPMGASKLQTDGDKYLLNVFGFAADAGLYGAAYRVVLLGTLPLLALDTAAFQRFLPKGDGRPGLHWRRSTRLGVLMLVASLVVTAVLFAALPLLDFLFVDDFVEARDIVPWLLLLIPLIATSNTPLNGLLGLGRSDRRMLVYLVTAIVSVVLYLVLIPPYGWQGALVATVVSEVFLSVAGWSTLWYYQRAADRTRLLESPDSVLSEV